MPQGGAVRRLAWLWSSVTLGVGGAAGGTSYGLLWPRITTLASYMWAFSIFGGTAIYTFLHTKTCGCFLHTVRI